MLRYIGYFDLDYIVTCQAHRLSKKKANQKDPWPRVLSLPERFVGDPVSLACDNIYRQIHTYSQTGPSAISVFFLT